MITSIRSKIPTNYLDTLPYHLQIDIAKYVHQMNLQELHVQYHRYLEPFYGGFLYDVRTASFWNDKPLDIFHTLSLTGSWWRSSDSCCNGVNRGQAWQCDLPEKYVYSSGKNKAIGYLDEPIALDIDNEYLYLPHSDHLSE